MGTDAADAFDRDEQFQEVLASYLQAVEARQAPAREELLARHPELADELASFFDNRDHFDRLAGPHRRADAAALPTPPTLACDDTVPAAPDYSGRVVGDYEVLGEVAHGGMGVVFKARQKSLNRVVALKMIRAGEFASADEVGRFRREAEAAAQLDHPHIVPLYEVGEHDGQPYFSMRLVEGRSLSQAIAGGEWPAITREAQRRAARLTAVVARAVHYAHQRGLLHRDLKPANVLLDAGGEPHVTDFGLAKRLPAPGAETGRSLVTQPGVVVGTPSYMAPEQIEGEKRPTTAVDVYGLGAILYELLTGRPPFKAETPLETLLLVRSREPARPRAVNAHVDRDLETVCLTCLEKDPQRRYGSAEALAEDLDRWLAGEPIRARASRLPERLLKWARRRPALAGMAALVVVVTVLGVAGIAWKWREASDRAEAEAAAKGEAEEALGRAEFSLNLHRLALIERELSTGNVGRAEELLEECPERLRGLEWHILRRLSREGPRVLRGHKQWVLAVALSPDGRYAASAGVHNLLFGELKLWDVDTGKEVAATPVGLEPAVDLAFSPDGRLLASAGAAGTVRLWEVPSGKPGRSLRGHQGPISGVAFSPDGRRLASASMDGTVRVWEVASGEERLHFRGHNAEVLSVAFGPDGGRVASWGTDNLLRVWDATTGREFVQMRGHGGRVFGLAFSPDGRRLASGGADGIRIWDADTGKEVRAVHGINSATLRILFTPDGTRLVSVNWDRAVKVWDLATGEETLTLRGPTDFVKGLALSGDGRRLAASSFDGTVWLWDATPPAERPPGVRAVLRGHGHAVLGIAFSPDGKRVATAGVDGTARVWEGATGRPVHTLKGHAHPVTGVAFGAGGKRLASVSFDGTLMLWDSATGRLERALPGHLGTVLSTGFTVAFSPDGERLASVIDNTTAKVREVATGREVGPPLKAPGLPFLMAVEFAPDGKHLAGVSFAGVRVWDARTHEEVRSFPGVGNIVHALAYGPGGRHLATASWDGTISLWDVAAGKEVHRLRGHDDRVLCVAFSPDGRYLASGSCDNRAKVWDVKTGKEVATLRGQIGYVMSVAFSPDGKTLAVGSGHRYKGEVQLWDTAAVLGDRR